jgi:hypothetical protein
MKTQIVTIDQIDSIPDCNHKRVILNNGLTVVTGDHYEVGTPGIYIADGAIVPQKLLEEMWLWNHDLRKGRLAGKRGDRVKTRVLNGVGSAGLFYGAYYFDKGERKESPSWNKDWTVGQDVAQEIGIS